MGGGSFRVVGSVEGIGGIGGGEVGFGWSVEVGLSSFNISIFSTEVIMNENENEIQNEEAGLQISIQEMKQNLTKQFESMDAIKSSARTIFGAGSLIISIISAFELGKMNQSWFLLLFLFLYILLVIICIYILAPVKMDLPVKSDWGEIYEFFMGEKIPVLRTWVYSYIHTIQENNKIVVKREKLTVIAGIILAIIVVLILSFSYLTQPTS